MESAQFRSTKQESLETYQLEEEFRLVSLQGSLRVYGLVGVILRAEHRCSREPFDELVQSVSDTNLDRYNKRTTRGINQVSCVAMKLAFRQTLLECVELLQI